MATSALVDAGFLVALLSRRDADHRWAAALAPRFPPPWMTCEAVLSETSHLLGGRGIRSLASLLRRGAVVCGYRFADDGAGETDAWPFSASRYLRSMVGAEVELVRYAKHAALRPCPCCGS